MRGICYCHPLVITKDKPMTNQGRTYQPPALHRRVYHIFRWTRWLALTELIRLPYRYMTANAIWYPNFSNLMQSSWSVWVVPACTQSIPVATYLHAVSWPHTISYNGARSTSLTPNRAQWLNASSLVMSNLIVSHVSQITLTIRRSNCLQRRYDPCLLYLDQYDLSSFSCVYSIGATLLGLHLSFYPKNGYFSPKIDLSSRRKSLICWISAF